MSSSLNTSNYGNKIAKINPDSVSLNFEIVIEGDCLAIMLKEENRKLFAKIINRSHAVLVCRSSPKQKAEVIEFAKSINPKMISLAIGDGGNDVSMIKAADVGIGIFGKEGYQAVSSSDYAVAEFQFLRRLIFIHGRYSVRRITIFITQFLVKNIIFTLPFFLFAFDSAYSGQIFYEPGYATVFNAFASQLAICYFAGYDQDIECTLKSKQTKLLLPYLYSEMRETLSFNLKDFSFWYLYGLYSGVVLYYIPYYSYLNAIGSDGQTFGLWQFSFAPYVSICIINLAIVSIHIQAWSCATLIFYFVHIVLFYPGWVYIYNLWPLSDLYQSQFDLYTYGLFWLVVLFLSWLIMMPILFIRQGKSLFFPKLVNLVLSNKISNGADIEEKLRIDMIKLERDLESDSDDSVKMESEIGINNDARRSFPNINNINSQFYNHELAKVQTRTANSENLDDNSLDSKENLSNRLSINSRNIGESHSPIPSHPPLPTSSRSFKSHRTLSNIRKSASKSPSFEKFTENIKEFKNNKIEGLEGKRYSKKTKKK